MASSSTDLNLPWDIRTFAYVLITSAFGKNASIWVARQKTFLIVPTLRYSLPVQIYLKNGTSRGSCEVSRRLRMNYRHMRSQERPGGHRRHHRSPRRTVDEANRAQRNDGGDAACCGTVVISCMIGIQNTPSHSGRSLRQVGLNRSRCQALGEIGEGGVLVEDHSLW